MSLRSIRALKQLNQKEPPVEIYLPIADLPVNILVILAMGLAVGFISGMFGIGGGFLMTPLLIFVGISPAVAVASVTTHIAASSMSGSISYWRRRAIDVALVCMLLAGGIIGTAFGVWLFLVSHTRAMSSSITMAGMTPALVSTAISAWPILASWLGSIGDWPCLAVMMIVVEASWPCFRNSLTMEPRALSTDRIAPASCGVNWRVPGSYPPGK